jgi:hypothetical protein
MFKNRVAVVRKLGLGGDREFFFLSGSAIVGFLRGIVGFALPKRFRFASVSLPKCFRNASGMLPLCFRNASAFWKLGPLMFANER